jgi:hypothetical protein
MNAPAVATLPWPDPANGNLKIESDAVKVDGLPPRFKEFLDRLGWIHFGLYALPLIITSGNDGQHGAQSLHYENRAVDVRTKDVPLAAGDVLATIITYFSELYTLALFDERQVPGGPHFHIEYHGA